MDFGLAFTFIQEDEDWAKKVGIAVVIFLAGMLFLFIPFILVYGYQISVTRNVINGKKKPLPDWQDWGQYFMDGAIVIAAQIVYMLPAMIPFFIGFAAFLLPALSGGNDDVAGALAAVGFGIYFLMLCLGILVAMVAGFVSPALHIQYVRTGEFGALFRVGEVFGIVRENVTDILMTFVATFVALIIIQAIGGVLFFTICGPFIIALVGRFWVMMANGHLYGQIASKSGYMAKAG